MALGQRDHPEDIPKWIPKQFLSVTAQVLLDRAAILIRDVQPENPVISGDQNPENQPAYGF